MTHRVGSSSGNRQKRRRRGKREQGKASIFFPHGKNRRERMAVRRARRMFIESRAAIIGSALEYRSYTRRIFMPDTDHAA